MSESSTGWRSLVGGLAELAPWDWAVTSPSRGRRLVQGVVLGLGAPSGWLAWRTLVDGVDPIDELITQADLYLYMAIGTCLSFSLFAWALSRSESELQKANAELSKLAVTDELTSLRNGLFFRVRAEEAWAEVERSGKALSVIVLDLDHFKRVNDEHGHLAGDEVLEELGLRLADEVRGSDTAARVGGEEFSVLLPGTETPAALAVAERIRARVANEPFATRAGQLDITISAGVATGRGDEHDAFRELYNAADAALYRAKKAGRNCVES